MITESLTEYLRSEPRSSHAAYPQYDGYFDGWTLGSTTRRICTKGGTDLPVGSLVLTNFHRGQNADLPEIGDCVSVYDPATTHIVLVERGFVAEVEVTTMIRHRNGLVWMEG